MYKIIYHNRYYINSLQYDKLEGDLNQLMLYCVKILIFINPRYILLK